MKNHEADFHIIIVSMIKMYLSEFMFLMYIILTVHTGYFILGNNHMKEENYAAAVDCYTQAIELDSNNAVYYCNR